MVLFTVCAFVGLDTLGTVASNGRRDSSGSCCSGRLFVLPYALLMAEAGSTFTEEGGPYEWMKLAWGRFAGGIGAVFYWVSNPLWVGGSLAFLSTEAWRANVSGIGHGTWGDYAFKLRLIWFSIGVAIASLKKGKWIPNVGAALRFLTLGLFSVTVVVYGIEHGFHGFAASDAKPTRPCSSRSSRSCSSTTSASSSRTAPRRRWRTRSRDVPVSVSRPPRSAC